MSNVSVEERGSSFYISGIGDKPIKIPSQLYPLNGTPVWLWHDTTEPFPDDKRTERIRDAFDSVGAQIGRCYHNAELLLAALEEHGISGAESYVGWRFDGVTMPIHHCFVVIDHVHVLDFNIRTSLLYHPEDRLKKLEDVRKSVVETFVSLKDVPYSEKATFGQMEDDNLYIATPCKPSAGLATFSKLMKAFPKHPGYQNITNGTNDTQREIYKRLGKPLG